MYYVRRPYSIAFKRMILAEIHSGRYTPVKAAAAHGVDFSSVYKWLKLYGDPGSHHESMSMPDDRDRIKELEREKKALETALARAKEKIILLESTVEVMEERYGSRAKKKTDRASSSEPGTKGLA
jgi:transposase-like protein